MLMRLGDIYRAAIQYFVVPATEAGALLFSKISVTQKGKSNINYSTATHLNEMC